MQFVTRDRPQILEASAHSRVPVPFFLVLRAYFTLVLFDLYITRGNFASLYRKVHTYPRRQTLCSENAAARICAAVDMATIWYWKQIQCLQRSAATACLLRSQGFRAEMVIGAQMIPYKVHAWVEIDGNVVSDKPYMHEIYQLLDRV
jgi:hypothetical protein